MNCIKNIVISLLIVSTLSSSLLVPLIYVDFEVRRDYIEKVLCIEREKPITVCKGSCYLQKRIDYAAQHQDQESKMLEKEIVFFSQKFTPTKLTNKSYLIYSCVFNFGNEFLNYSSHLSDVFHPPQLS
ncbi:hypothetical protein [Ekhidna sp.]